MIAFLPPIHGLSATAMAGIACVLALTHGPARRSEPQREVIRPVPAQSQNPGQPVKPRIPVEIIRVIDGDTVEVRAQIWIDQQVTTKVRLRSIDAPERKGRCASESLQAEKARDQLVALIKSGQVFLTDLDKDKYGGRVIGTLLTARGDDIGQSLIASGHARPYAGGRRQAWC
jgi:micrococcal nuclease